MCLLLTRPIISIAVCNQTMRTCTCAFVSQIYTVVHPLSFWRYDGRPPGALVAAQPFNASVIICTERSTRILVCVHMRQSNKRHTNQLRFQQKWKWTSWFCYFLCFCFSLCFRMSDEHYITSVQASTIAWPDKRPAWPGHYILYVPNIFESAHNT